MNQTELADASGVNRTAINHLFNDTCKRIDFETLEKICNYFQCELNDLLELQELDQ